MATILIVDDDSQIRLMLSQILQRAGYTVEEAPDGKDALKMAKQKQYDLVITDIIMPEKEGIETITELKKDCPDIKIIAISGGGRHRPEGYLELARGLGANHTLTKPFEREEILQIVGNLLNS